MPDYFDAFKAGLEAVEAAKIARKEIAEVFTELNQQISQGSDGKIKIDRRDFYVKEQGIAALGGLATMSYILGGKKRETYRAIAAHNPLIPDCPSKELAKWSQDRAGYPCKIVWANTERSCGDRESLEIGLIALLRDPEVGEKLSELIKMEPPPPKEEQAQKADVVVNEVAPE